MHCGNLGAKVISCFQVYGSVDNIQGVMLRSMFHIFTDSGKLASNGTTITWSRMDITDSEVSANLALAFTMS